MLPALIVKAKALKVGCGRVDGVDIGHDFVLFFVCKMVFTVFVEAYTSRKWRLMTRHPCTGPIISKEALERIRKILDASEKAGVTFDLDGRAISVAGYEQGNFIGPTILSGVKEDMPCYTQEIFGPVLCCIKVANLDEAIALVNRNTMGNGVALFTTSGGAARKFEHEIEVGQIGINVPVPVPLPFFCWSSSKGSILGDHHFYGKSAVAFYTQIKTTVSRWEYREIDSDTGCVNFSGR